MKQKITIEDLQYFGACEEQQEIFKAEWPNGALINEKNYRRAQALGLNVRWVLLNCLTGAGYRKNTQNREKIWDKYYSGKIYLDERRKQVMAEDMRAARADFRKHR